jgi:hypothetical protein
MKEILKPMWGLLIVLITTVGNLQAQVHEKIDRGRCFNGIL